MELPGLEGFSYLVDYLFEVGPTMSTGMGLVPIPFTEIDSWARSTSLDLTPWEVLSLKKLSAEYLSEYNQADELDRPAPYCRKLSFEDRQVVNDKLGGWLRSFAKLKSKKR